MAKRNSILKRVELSDPGGFSKAAWVSEAGGHLLSSQVLRRAFERRRSNASGQSKKPAIGARDHRRIIQEIGAMEGTAKSSMLLLGYSIELFLKAGLPALYAGCSHDLFEWDVRKVYGHELVKIATAVNFPMSKGDKATLEFFKDVILHLRYPSMISDRLKHIEEWNRRTGAFWSRQKFKESLGLCRRIREHTANLDANEANPAFRISLKIDKDGYLAFRRGGGLKTLITVKYSSYQRARSLDSKSSLFDLIVRNEVDPILERVWERSDFREVSR